MTSENVIRSEEETAEPAQENAECCPNCHSTTDFRLDKKLGYYELCLNGGHIEYLHRRFLRFNRQSRTWQ